MNLKDLKKNWDNFGKEDPYWSILTKPESKGNKWNEEAFFATGQNLIAREVNAIKRIKPDFSFHSALDFGCGVGRLTQGLAQHFDQASGVDIAPSMINLANKKNKKNNCQYFLNDKNDLSIFGNEEFNFVYSMITLQHMQPQYAKNYIDEFLRILKPGGILKFQIPSKPNLGARLYHNPLNKLRLKIINVLDFRKKNHEIAVMEMYWIPVNEMIEFLTRKGIEILEIKKDNSAGDTWKSHIYMVSKLQMTNKSSALTQ